MKPQLRKLLHKHRPALRRFGIRFVISLIIFGGAYLAIFGSPIRPKGPSTPAGKYAAIRSSTTSLNLSVQSLASLTATDPTAYSQLSTMHSRAVQQTKDVSEALKRAPKTLSESERTQTQRLIDDATLAANSYKTLYDTLDKVLQYDPATDLALSASDPALLQRATAAKEGISGVTNSAPRGGSLGVNAGGDGKISAATNDALQASAACFGKMAQALESKKTSEANQTKQSCIRGYTDVRQKVVADILKNSYNKDYAARSQQQTDQLTRALDAASPAAAQPENR